MNDNNPGWGVSGGAPNPLYTTCEEITISEHKMIHIVGKGFNSRTAGAAAATGFTKAHVAIYPKTATAGRIFSDNLYNTGATFSGLTPGQWNYVEVPVTFTNNYILVALDDETEFYLDHFYLSKPAEDEMDVTVTGNKAVITGPVTAADITTLQTAAANAAVIDLKGATITEDITITPANQNAVVVVGGTGRTPNESGAHVTANNLVVYESPYYRAATAINIVDDNDAQPAYDFVIDAQQDGFAYTRTIAANAWVSYNSPATVTIPDGVTVYKATAATTGGVTFTKQVSQALGANDPVILHNTTDAPVVIASNNTKGDLNLTANPAGTDIATSGIIMHRTGRAIEATGAEYALQDGKLKKFNAGAKIGAFRVYFTGLTGTEARAFFDDGDATGISNLTISSKSEKNEYYTLDGRKVSQPQKGLYIVNGKKVVIK
jgi:hypothetical protein